MVADPHTIDERDEQRDNPRPEGTWEAIRRWFKGNWAQSLIFVGVLLGYLLFGVVLWWFLDWYINPQGSAAKKDLIQALGLIMAGLAGAIGIYFTWRNLTMTQRNMEDTQENTQEQLNTAQAQLRLAEEGQVTERFTKVIDQLGEKDDENIPRLEIRIGGIYALERIAHHYQEHSPGDYGPIIELLAAYVRENAKWLPNEESGPTLKVHEVAEFLTTLYRNAPRGDIQAALDVLGRRNEGRMSEQYQVALDLFLTDLSGVRLIGAELSGADLTRANLSRAFLHKANLSAVDLSGADLSGAIMSGADLSGAFLPGARLEGAILTASSLTGHGRELVRRRLGITRQEAGNTMFIEGTNIETTEGLSQEQIEWAIGDSSTKPPYYLETPEAWRKTLVPPTEPPAERYDEWLKCFDEYNENLTEQFRHIEERLKQEYR